MKTARITAVTTICLLLMAAPGCYSGGGDNPVTPVATVTYNLDFSGGAIHDMANRPDPIPGPSTPIITDTNYYPIVRQGGLLTCVITFDDDDFAGVTTVILQVKGSDGYYTFDVTPIDDPLNPGVTTVTFTATLDPDFQPGSFTVYMGLMDQDGNISEYVARLLVVKSIADLGIAGITPADGSQDVPINARVVVNFSQQIYPGEAELTLLHNGMPTPGAAQLSPNGRKLVFNPDAFLVPGDTYNATATLLVNGHSVTSNFTTSNPPPLSDPSALYGKVFGTIITKESIVEPEEGKLVFDMIIDMLAPILNKIVTLDLGTGAMTTVGGLSKSNGSGGWIQGNLIPAYGPDPGTLMDPWFSFGPSEFVLPLAPLGLSGNIAIHDMVISGHFGEDPNGVLLGFGRGVLTGRIDSAEINVILEAKMQRQADLCQLVAICDEQGFVHLRLEELLSPVISGIDYLYGIKCSGDVDTIQADLGGPIQVTCTTTQDGAGFQGNFITFSAATSISGSKVEVGSWDYLAATCAGSPPSCLVGPTGQVTVQVDIAPYILTTGDLTFQVGGAYASPVGNMSYGDRVDVQ